MTPPPGKHLDRGPSRPLQPEEGLRATPQPYRLQLEEGDPDHGRVRGSLLLADGSPCIDATLSIKGPQGRQPGICDLSEGSFDVGLLPAGKLLLVVSRPLRGYWTTRFHLAPGQDLDLGALQLPPPGTLRVFNKWPLEDADGRPLYTLVSVIVEDLDGPRPFQNARVPNPLQGELEFLPAEVEIFVCVAGYSVDSRRVTVRSGEVTEVEFVPPFEVAEPFRPKFVDEDGKQAGRRRDQPCGSRRSSAEALGTAPRAGALHPGRYLAPMHPCSR